MRLHAILSGLPSPVKAVLLLAAVVVGVILPQVSDTFFLSMYLLALIYGLFAMSINLLAHTGLVSLGQAGIFATSAYGAAYVVTYENGGYAEQIIVGLAAAVLMSAVFGVMAMRTSGVYFLMVTLAQGEIVFGLANSLVKFGADSGMSGILRPPWVQDNTSFYYLCLAVLLACLFLMRVIIRSPFGLAMRGLRASPTRLDQLGYNPTLHNFYSFVIAGFFAGVAGLLFVYDNQFISPEAASFTTSAQGVLMVIIGGIGTLSGPLVGSAVIVAIQNWLSLYVERWPMIEGAVFVAVVLFARSGVVGSISQAWNRWSPWGTRQARTPAAVGIDAMALPDDDSAATGTAPTTGVLTNMATREGND